MPAPASYFTVTFKTAAVPVLILSILLQDCTEFLIVKMIKRESLLRQKAQTAGTVSLLNSKNQDRITMQTNTQHKLLSVRAIQKEKLLHYLLVKTRSRDKATGDLKTQAQGHWPQQEPEWQKSIKTVENGGWTCKLLHFYYQPRRKNRMKAGKKLQCTPAGQWRSNSARDNAF